MTSNDREQRSSLEDVEAAISQDATVRDEDFADGIDPIDAILDRLVQIEGTLEGDSDKADFFQNLNEYVDDLKGEIRDLKSIRKWSARFAFGYSFALFSGIVFVAVADPYWFMILSDSYKIPFFVALSGGAVFLIALVLRGAFQGRADRHKGDYLPEHLKFLRDEFLQRPK